MTTTAQDVRIHSIPLPDGRVLEVHDYGELADPVVIAHHGTPGSGVGGAVAVGDALGRGIRLVQADRAGYGPSDRYPRRTVADVAADTAAVADALGIERFWTWGMSGGGPHALACAALIPERVVAAASIAGVAPHDAAELDFLAGMGKDNVEEFRAAMEGEEPYRKLLAPMRVGMLDATDEQLLELLDSLLPDVDRAALTAGLVEGLRAGTRHGLGAGVDGWVDDGLAFVSPWGFDPSGIRVPTLIFQGEQDLMVPYAHGRWLCGAMPKAEAWLSPDLGHISLMTRIGDVHDWLLRHSA